MDGVDEFVVGEDVADDDDLVAEGEQAAVAEQLFGAADGDFGVAAEIEDEGIDTAQQVELVGQPGGVGEGKDGGVRGTQPTGVLRHVTVAGEDENAFGAKFVGHDDGAADDFLSFVGQIGVGGVVGTAAAFDAHGDAVHDFDAFERVFADGRFAAEHDRVGLLEDGIGDVGDFGAGGQGILDHAFEHVGGDDDGFAEADAVFDDATLDDGQFFVGDFNAEVAAGDHDGVGGGDEFEEVLDGGLVFDFGDDAGVGSAAVAEQLAQFGNVVGFAHEGEGDEVNAELDAELDIAAVLVGDGGQGDVDAGEVDVAAAAKFALGEDFAFDAAVKFFEDSQFDHAVVEQDGVAVVDVVDEVGVIDVHGFFFFALGAFDGQFEDVTGFELERQRQVAGANGGALGVEHDRAGPTGLLGGGTDAGDDGAGPVVSGVAHVEAEDIHAGRDEFFQHVGRFGARPDGADNFGASHVARSLSGAVVFVKNGLQGGAIGNRMRGREGADMKTIAVYPGSFDPITNGHLDVIRRAATMFDRVYVAVARNAEKKPLFTVAERAALARASMRGWRGVTVDDFDGLLVRYARRKRARVVIRGLRAVSDFEYEFQMALMNRRLDASIETIFLMPKDEYTFLRSRVVKEVASLGGDVSAFVPRVVEQALARKLGGR